jgi:hypothetical protein
MKSIALALSILVVAAIMCEAGDSAKTLSNAPPAVVTKFLTLFDQLRAAQTQKTQGTPQHVSFKLSDAEIDEYMRYSLHAIPRPGLDSVTVKFFPANYVSTFTVIDFDAVERWHPGTIPSLLRSVLSGKKSIWVDYRINANNSKMSFSVEKAYYQSLRLPAFSVEKMIEIVAARQPEKYDTSKPMEIPFGLRQVWTNEHTIEGRN